MDGASKRPYTIRGTERFATIRSQGSGGAAGRAVERRIRGQSGAVERGQHAVQIDLVVGKEPAEVGARARIPDDVVEEEFQARPQVGDGLG